MLNYTYLSTKKNILEFDYNQIAQYDYLVIFDLGSHSNTVTENERALLLSGLAGFMHHECLVVSATELAEAPEGTTMKSVYHFFDPPDYLDAYIAIATVRVGVNDKLLTTPVYSELIVEEKDPFDDTPARRYPLYSALNHCMEGLRTSLQYASLAEFPLPPGFLKEKNMVSPYGKRIETLRKKQGSVNKVSTDSEGKPCQPKQTTLRQAEKSEPITRAKLEEIACFFQETPESITFQKIVPRKGKLRDIRKQKIGATKKELADQLELSSDFFFDLLEEAELIPAETMMFIYFRYRKILENKKKLQFAELVDLHTTASLKPALEPNT